MVCDAFLSLAVIFGVSYSFAAFQQRLVAHGIDSCHQAPSPLEQGQRELGASSSYIKDEGIAGANRLSLVFLVGPERLERSTYGLRGGFGVAANVDSVGPVAERNILRARIAGDLALQAGARCVVRFDLTSASFFDIRSNERLAVSIARADAEAANPSADDADKRPRANPPSERIDR